MKYLLVVDLQPEFVKDGKGKKIYQACLEYIRANKTNYHGVIAAIYENTPGDNPNMDRLLDWNECKDVMPIEFIANAAYTHSGYSIKEYPRVSNLDQIDIIGFDTDACVLSAAFDVFNLGCNMRILTDLCWSSGGKKMHEAGLLVMKRQFGKACVTSNSR